MFKSLIVGQKYVSVHLVFFITPLYLADILAIEGSLTERLKTLCLGNCRRVIFMSHSFKNVILFKE